MALVSVGFDKNYLKRTFRNYTDTDLKREVAYFSLQVKKIKEEIKRRESEKNV